jgi:hypothetical protein
MPSEEDAIPLTWAAREGEQVRLAA